MSLQNLYWFFVLFCPSRNLPRPFRKTSQNPHPPKIILKTTIVMNMRYSQNDYDVLVEIFPKNNITFESSEGSWVVGSKTIEHERRVARLYLNWHPCESLPASIGKLKNLQSKLFCHPLENCKEFMRPPSHITLGKNLFFKSHLNIYEHVYFFLLYVTFCL